jgi:hypothetical protein
MSAGWRRVAVNSLLIQLYDATGARMPPKGQSLDKKSYTRNRNLYKYKMKLNVILYCIRANYIYMLPYFVSLTKY